MISMTPNTATRASALGHFRTRPPGVVVNVYSWPHVLIHGFSRLRILRSSGCRGGGGHFCLPCSPGPELEERVNCVNSRRRKGKESSGSYRRMPASPSCGHNGSNQEKNGEDAIVDEFDKKPWPREAADKI